MGTEISHYCNANQSEREERGVYLLFGFPFLVIKPVKYDDLEINLMSELHLLASYC